MWLETSDVLPQEDSGIVGKVVVMGTPAKEKAGGGKIQMLNDGAFADVDVVGLMHPSQESGLFSTTLCSATVSDIAF